jgi:hypothetical protein
MLQLHDKPSVIRVNTAVHAPLGKTGMKWRNVPVVFGSFSLEGSNKRMSQGVNVSVLKHFIPSAFQESFPHLSISQMYSHRLPGFIPTSFQLSGLP